MATQSAFSQPNFFTKPARPEKLRQLKKLCDSDERSQWLQQRAYELWEQRGKQPDNGQGEWEQAKAENPVREGRISVNFRNLLSVGPSYYELAAEYQYHLVRSESPCRQCGSYQVYRPEIWIYRLLENGSDLHAITESTYRLVELAIHMTICDQDQARCRNSQCQLSVAETASARVC